jgi:hypothetical protein
MREKTPYGEGAVAGPADVLEARSTPDGIFGDDSCVSVVPMPATVLSVLAAKTSTELDAWGIFACIVGRRSQLRPFARQTLPSLSIIVVRRLFGRLPAFFGFAAVAFGGFGHNKIEPQNRLTGFGIETFLRE